MSVFEQLKPKNHTDEASKMILEAHLSVSEFYETMDSEFRKEKIRIFIATNPDILNAERAISEQYQLAIAGDPKAMERVKEGIEYWKQLILREMRPI